MRLFHLANELLSIASHLEQKGIAGPGAWTTIARAAYRDRRRRARAFGGEELFGEPAWDILLDLFIAGEEGKRVSVTSACIGAAVPTTTALRWIAILEERGLILRENDRSDARRVFVRLSAEGRTRMVDYFGDGKEAGLPQLEAGDDEGGMIDALQPVNWPNAPAPA